MDYTKILTRSFEIVREHRALWLFGVLLALFGGGGGGGGGFPGGGGGGTGLTGAPPPKFPTIDFNALIPILVAIGCLIVVLGIVGFVLRLVSRAALIGLVNELEAKQTTPTAGRGFRMGFDNFWRLLGIAILVNLPLALASILILGVTILPILAVLMTAGPQANFNGWVAFGAAGSIMLFCGAFVFLVLLALAVRPIYEMIVRACVVSQRGAIDSIREGFRIVRANLRNVLVLYILVIAVGIGFGIAMIPVALILIALPVVIGFAVYFAANAITPALIAGAVVGVPVIAILIFLSGLFRAFESTVWTEGYLQVTRKPLSPQPSP